MRDGESSEELPTAANRGYRNLHFSNFLIEGSSAGFEEMNSNISGKLHKQLAGAEQAEILSEVFHH